MMRQTNLISVTMKVFYSYTILLLSPNQTHWFPYTLTEGFEGIQPPAKPAWYDQSSADSAFHAHIIQPALLFS